MLGTITATGAVTSVGLTASASCAAIRSGVARPSPIETQVVDADTQELVQLTGHPIAGYTDGFQALGRWIRLASGAVADLLRQPGVPPFADARFWGRTAMLLVTSEPDEEVLLLDRASALRALQEDYAGMLRKTLGLPIQPKLVPHGQAGAVLGLESVLGKARTDIDRVLVLAADSRIDPLLLQKLGMEGRLKTDEDPTGLMPGEAGAAFLLDCTPGGRTKEPRSDAALLAVGSASEPAEQSDRPPCSGRGVASCVGKVLDTHPSGDRFEGDMVLDLNGEDWRARDWGSALVRLGHRIGAVRAFLPATSLGDTGAASGVLGVCLAVHLLRRGVARRDLLVVSRNEAGATGCLAIRTLA